ncbi:MAG: choice-of-anchor Q domain-containing protein [Nitrospira sp.]|nr:hypothetical protein [Nitrospira sp.]
MIRYDCSGRMRRTRLVLGLSLLVLCAGLLPGCQTVASFNVNTVSDLHDAQLGDGLCDTNLTQGGSQCSLRAAIEEANAFDPGSRIAVNFTVSGTFELSLPSGREGAGNSLFVAGGRFVDLLAGNDPADHIIRPASAHQSRLFTIEDALVRLSGLTLTQGGVDGTEGRGGALSIQGDSPRVEITNSVIENNAASWRGGGIYANAGSNSALLISDSMIRNNEAGGGGQGGGGGIWAKVGYFGLTRVTVTGTIDGGQGGGLLLSVKDADIFRSAITQNHGGNGAGLKIDKGTVVIGQSTIAQNVAANTGGGIAVLGGDVTLRDVTLVGNQAAVQAGGLWHFVDADGVVRLRNTILAGNSSPAHRDCDGAITSDGFNLIGTIDGCEVQTQGSDLTGTDDHLRDPQLDNNLALNGGTTDNLLPSEGSVVIDAGGSCYARDQRGRTRPVNGDGQDGAQCDIGAVEWQPGVGPGPGDVGEGSGGGAGRGPTK